MADDKPTSSSARGVRDHSFFSWELCQFCSILFNLFKFVLKEHKFQIITFISIALYTIQIVSKQLYSVKQENSVSILQAKFNSVVKQHKKCQ